MLPTAWLALCATAFVMGLRHGLDADHLAAIDGLTRYNSAGAPRLARWSGMLFALGHGAMVLLTAGIVGSTAVVLSVPEWLEGVGAWISIAFLVALGALNLRIVLTTPAEQVVNLSGIRAGPLLRLFNIGRPFGVAAVGFLFAVSFDTLTQVLLFATAATRMGGALRAVQIGLVFVTAMALVDGLNGGWLAGLMRAQDRRARLASRVLGLFVALLSFGVAGVGAVRYFDSRLDAVLEGYSGVLGVALILGSVVVVGLIGRLTSRRRQTAG
jgi:high-affinity nickel-transport protein